MKLLLLISFLISIFNIIIIRDTYIKYREREYYKNYYNEDIYDAKKEDKLYWRERQRTYYLKGSNIITKLLLIIRKIICRILNLLSKRV